MSSSNHFQFDCRIFLNHSKCSISDSVLTVKCKMFPINWIAMVYLLAISTFNVADSITVTINKHITATEETNGTYLECHYSRENVDFFTQVFVQTLNGTEFENMISFVVNKNAYINHKWEFLKDRITFNNITNDANGTRIHFMKLLCVDNRSYRCHVKYVPQDSSSDPGYANSDISNISVTVDPSVPDNLSYSAANLSITSEIVHAQNCSTNDEILIEGGSIIVLCDGNVGRPAGNLIVQKIQNNSELYNFTAIDNKSSSPDNCSFYLNSTFTVNLTAEDNGGHLRCAEERYVLNNEMSKKSDPLDVKYQVRTPKITGDSNELPRTLTCISTGNPIPEYTWYRITNNSDTWELYANDTQNITLTNVSDSGLYRCDVSNTIGCKTFRQNDTLNITFEVQATTVTTTTLLTTVLKRCLETTVLQTKNNRQHILSSVN